MEIRSASPDVIPLSASTMSSTIERQGKTTKTSSEKQLQVTFDEVMMDHFRPTELSSDEGLYNDAGFQDKGFTKRDQRDMRRLGKRQELMRNYRPLSALAFTVMIQATWEFLLMSNYQGLVGGGLAGLWWSYLFTYIGFAFVILSLAEMASMAPTSGGQYHWVSEFSPPQYQRYLSYVTGWMSTLSWQAGAASGTFITGTVIQALLSANDPTYEPKSWQGTLLVFAMVLICTIANIWGAKGMPLIQNVLLMIHVFAFIAVILVMWVMCPRNTASTVFTQFYATGGWSSTTVSVMIGQISSVYALSCSDATAHMAEEIKDASRNVPNAMFFAYVLNGFIGGIVLITFLFGVTDIDAALEFGYPFIWVFQQAVSITGVNVLVTLILILGTAANIVFNASTSRQTFAFARDNGLPFAEWLGRVHPTYHVPVNSVLFSSLFSCLLSLINIGSTAAFSAIVSLQISALMFTYILSIACVLWRRLYRPQTLPLARWSLGSWGVLVNSLGIAYALFAFFWSFWPSTTLTEIQDFNWAIVLFVIVVIIAQATYWVRGGKQTYLGPVVTVEGRRRSSNDGMMMNARPTRLE